MPCKRGIIHAYMALIKYAHYYHIYRLCFLDSSKRGLLREAFARYKAMTCIEFVERKGERDFIEFVGGSG